MDELNIRVAFLLAAQVHHALDSRLESFKTEIVTRKTKYVLSFNWEDEQGQSRFYNYAIAFDKCLKLDSAGMDQECDNIIGAIFS